MPENGSSGFPTSSDTNRHVQSQKKAGSLKFGLMKKRNCTIRVAKTKVLISCTVTASAPLFSHRQKSGFLMTGLIFFMGIY